MIKPDVILSWPRNTDYPLWRQFIRDNRNRFNEIIIVFTETHQGEDYRNFVREAMFPDHVLCTQSPVINPGEDWRNVAVNFGLLQSLHAEWIWFTEQDFTPLDLDYLLEDKLQMEYKGVYEGTRLHPCCIVIKRELLNKTKKQFGAHPPEHDHFGQLQKDLMLLAPEQKWVMDPAKYEHMAGLSHNMRLIADGQPANHQVEAFKNYLYRCLNTTVARDPRFDLLVNNYLMLSDTATP